MKIDFSPNCQKKLAVLKRKDASLFKLVSKQLLCFQQQPNHPSLRLHKLKEDLNDTWSISITHSVRMVFYYREVEGERGVVFIAIGTHKEVYK